MRVAGEVPFLQLGRAEPADPTVSGAVVTKWTTPGDDPIMVRHGSGCEVAGGNGEGVAGPGLDRVPCFLPGRLVARHNGRSRAEYVLMAEIVNIEHWQQQAELRVQALADDLEHLVSSRRMLVLERIL